MQAVQCARFGDASEVTEVVELPDPGPPGEGEVVLDILASPINPSDFLFCQGRFGTPPQLPAACGGEAVARVAAVGAGVRHLRVGDRVLALYARRGNWRQRVKTAAAPLFPLTTEAKTSQLAMLAVNPATASLMLTEFVSLSPREWVLQNAGNSGVGRSVIALARARGIRTVSVVRRDEQVAPLRAAGADAVLVDGEDLPARVAAAVGGALPRLAFDAVAGTATARLADGLAIGGTVVNYGMLSHDPCRIDAAALVFRGITLRGFWLTKWLADAAPDMKRRLHEQLCALVADGTIAVPVEAVYPLSRVREALVHAARPHRSGKILLAPNGPIDV